MTARLIPLPPAEVAARLAARTAVLVDIREADEFVRAHAKGAVSRPLSAFETAHLKIEPSQSVVFTCRTGMRTGAACDRLAASVEGDAFVLEGGLDSWAAARLPVVESKSAPIEIMRQVQIAAGGLVLLGVLLSVFVNPAFVWLAGAIGAGLTFAGVSGSCGMAYALRAMPWNRAAG